MKIYQEAEVITCILMEKTFCILLSILFVGGVSANVYVLKCILENAFRSQCRRSRSADRRRRCDRKSPPRHVYVYIGALLLSDLLLLLNCPFVIHDVADGGWRFGTFLCKFVSGNESFHKVLTGLLLAALSFDQLITVRKILSPRWRTATVAAITICGCALVDILIQIPVFIYADVTSLNDPDFGEMNESVFANGTIENDSDLFFVTTEELKHMLSGEKCLFNPPSSMAKAFTICIFVVGFCLPTFLILISYGTIIDRMIASGYFKAVGFRRRHKNSRVILRQKSSVVGCRLITWYVSLLVAIYLCCWGPYWIATGLLAQTGDGSWFNSQGDAATYFLLYLHLLPYLNALLNPFAYGYLVQCCVSRKSFDADEEERQGTNRFWGMWRGNRLSRRSEMTTTDFDRGCSLEETWGKPTGTPRSRNWSGV